MCFPIRGQLAADCLLPLLAEIGVLFFVSRNQIVPFVLRFRAAIDRFTKMRQRFVRNIELPIFRSAEMPLGFADSFFAGRVAVRLAGAGSRHAVADD